MVVYAVLVATNLGEFWPFSIYPMFSQGGIPWSRAVVREVPAEMGRATSKDAIPWEPSTLDELPGDPYSLAQHGIDHIDLANFVSKTDVWDDDRLAGLRKMFGEAQLERRNLLVMRARGRIIHNEATDRDSVVLTFEPYVLLTSDSTTVSAALALNTDTPPVR